MVRGAGIFDGAGPSAATAGFSLAQAGHFPARGVPRAARNAGAFGPRPSPPGSVREAPPSPATTTAKATSRGESALPVRVQCPHCKSICQIATELLGSSVKCASCGRPYALPPATPAQAPSVTAASSALCQSPDEEEISIELDGPAAAALASP